MNRLFKSLSNDRIKPNEEKENDLVLSSSEEEIKPKKNHKLCKLYNDESSVSIVSNFSSSDIKFSRGSFRFCMTDNEILLVFHPMFLWKLLHAKKICVDIERDFCKTRSFISMLINNTNSVTFRLNEKQISYYIDDRIKTYIMDDSYNYLSVLFYKLSMSIQQEYEYSDLLDEFFKKCVDILYYIS
jgi:hypothetical protein